MLSLHDLESFSQLFKVDIMETSLNVTCKKSKWTLHILITVTVLQDCAGIGKPEDPAFGETDQRTLLLSHPEGGKA